MIKILDKYLWKETLYGLLIAWIALVTLDVFFAFINEADKTDELYTTSQAAIYLVYTLPSRFYEFFPTSILIGSLLGLGNLAANSEFTAMRAAGISIKQIIFSVLKLGIILAVLIFAMGEWLVPTADLQARNFKTHLKNKNITLVGGSGLWIKGEDNILHIKNILSKEELSEISHFTFKKNYSNLESLRTIESAEYANNTWNLKNINQSVFGEKSVQKSHLSELSDAKFVDQNILEFSTAKPEQLSTAELSTIIKHQKENSVKTDRYELIFWKRYSVPLSALVMLILAMPFLFGSSRGGGTGQRVFIGIIVGITFFLANRSINDLGIVYGFSPFLSAFIPSILLLFIGLFFIGRIR